jgi:hypothetical protein
VAAAATTAIAALIKAGLPHAVLHAEVVADLSKSDEFDP